MRVTLAGAIVALALAAGAAGSAAADEPPLALAVLRGDGILIPIATRQGDRWVNRWPEPRKRIAVPVRLGDLPRRWWGKVEPTGAWHAWLVDGTQTLATAFWDASASLDYAAAAPYAAALVVLSAPLTYLLLHGKNEEPLT